MAVSPAPRGAARPRRWSAPVAWALWALAMLGLAATFWLYQLLVQAGRPMTLDPLLVVAMVSAATVGAVLAGRRPAHPVGWLLLGLAVLLDAAGVAAAYGPYGLLARPGVLPAAGVVAVYYPACAVASLACLGFVLLLTPTGSLPSPRWRWWARVTAAAPLVAMVSSALLPFEQRLQPVTNPLAVPTLADPLLVVAGVALLTTGLTLLVAAWSLVVRFRRARGVERQQLRWVALAAALTAVAVLGIVAAAAIGIGTALDWLLGVCMALLPVAIGAAILRYRLYDLDRIISRTVAYGLLTVLLGGVYEGLVH